MSRRVLLHVGTPKTGTSYLQDVLFRNPEVLADAGICYPAERFDAHFLAALDLMRMPWGGLETEAVGAWDALAAAVRAHDGTAIVSHEILAHADRAQVRRALTSLGHGAGAEVHLVVSVRDLVRQIPAEWQENVKHRATLSYAEFLDQVRDPARNSRIGSWFWGVQELPGILDRWAADLPVEHVHIVTVPPPGTPPDLLWRRFTEAFGLDELALDLGTDRTNPSLGVAETALIRRINEAANHQLPPEHYRPLVRELLAHRTLSVRTGSSRLGLPPALAQWVHGIEQSWITEVRDRGHRVIGDLADLVGTPTEEWVDPDRPDEAEVAGAAVVALRAVLVEMAGRDDEAKRLRDELAHTRAALAEATTPVVQRGKEKVVQRLESSAAGRRALGVYRWVKSGNSRSA